jgi:DNA repair exonuclease SbcCD ATPase subunit
MKFVKMKWKNLLSYGNVVQEYKFSDKPTLVHIQGENGAGKSSIKEALTVSAYGKSAIRKIKDIPNWRNKNCYTYNEFETSKGDTVAIERGIDPNFSSILVNGVPYNLPDKRKVDDFVENELLGLNFAIFCNTISLSFDDFKSFVNLSAADKRKIVDPMFGIDLLTDMKLNIKEDLKENKKQLDIIESNINKNNILLEKSINQLTELREKINTAVEDRSKEINDEIESKKISLADRQEKYNQIKSKIDGIKKKAVEFGQKAADSNATINEFNRKLKIFENNKCPHCLSDLTGDSALQIKNSIIEKKKAESELLEKIGRNQETVKKLVTELTTDQDVEKTAFYEINASIKSLQAEIQNAANNKKPDGQEDSINKIINTIKEDIRESSEDSKEYKDNLELFGMLDEILSDKGIKKVLIDRVIPLLNNRITEISTRLEFKFNFEFDNEFNPNIRYLGMDISPESLSTGQRKKMNLIVLLSFIELIKLKHNNMNVMFLDEIFSGLDKRNVYMAIEILREYADKYNMTIFVVSHESLPEEFFDQRIDVTMPNHFSEIKVTSNIAEIKEPTSLSDV